MKSIIKVISQNSFFYSLNLLLIVFAAFLLYNFSQADGFVWLNQIHNTYLNFIFETFTFLGDGLFIIFISLFIMLFAKKHRNLAFIILLAYVSSGIFSQIIKSIITAPRPKVFFALNHFNYHLDTFETCRKGFNSFPSGHTASFFALATVLSNYCKNKQVCISMLMLSALVGYSRIYLAHHFLMDVLVGAIIGVIFGSLSMIWFSKIIKHPAVRSKKYFGSKSNSTINNPSLSK